MAKRELPRFVIYQSSQKEFHICFEVGGKFLRWCSYYPPTLDVRFPRKVNRISDIAPGKLPKKPVFDQGSYSVNKTDDKDDAQQKFSEGLGKKSFAFILNGKKLQGRFSLKRTGSRTVLQKYKDKYAQEEDVLSADLARTIHTMLPDYDERKVKLPRPQQPKPKTQPAPAPRQKDPEAITADKQIGGTMYHFTFYNSNTEGEICLVTNPYGAALVLRHQNRKWVLLPALNASVLKKQQDFAEHAAALYKLQDA